METQPGGLHRVIVAASRFASCTSTKQLGHSILAEASQIFAARSGSAYVRSQHHLKLVHALDPGHAAPEIPVPVDENSVFGRALAAESPILIQDIDSDTSIVRSGWGGYGDGSCLVVPLLTRGGPVEGILALHDKVGAPFSETDLELAELMAISCRTALKTVQALEALQRSEERFSAILDIAPDAIIAIDEEQRITLFNRSAEEIFEYSADEVLGQPLDILLPESLRAVHREHVRGISRQRFASRQMSARGDLRGRRKSGEEFYIEASISTMNMGGEFTLTVILRDVSERRKTEAILARQAEEHRHAQKLEAIGRLASGIAHDINNILTPITTNVHLLKKLRPTDSMLRELTGEIGRAAARGRDMMTQILTFSRHEQFGQFVPVQLDEVIRDVVDLLHASLPSSIEIAVTIPEGRWEMMGNNAQLHQVILNLGVNAGQSMADGGRLSFELSRVEVSERDTTVRPLLAAGRYAMLKVRDTGTGIAEDHAVQIFDPFFSTRPTATGLGLSILHGIVTTHDGTVSVDSSLGEGTTFTVMLPLAAPADSADDAIQGQIGTDHKPGRRVLLVDDEELILTTTARLLAHQGYEVESCLTSIEALERVRRDPDRFDVAVIDQTMPKMSGLKLASALLLMRKDLPIVLASGYLNAQLERQAEKVGVQVTINKPYLPEELSSALATAARRCPGRRA